MEIGVNLRVASNLGAILDTQLIHSKPLVFLVFYMIILLLFIMIGKKKLRTSNGFVTAKNSLFPAQKLPSAKSNRYEQVFVKSRFVIKSFYCITKTCLDRSSN